MSGARRAIPAPRRSARRRCARRGRGARDRVAPLARGSRPQPAAERARVESRARRADPRQPVRRAVEVRGEDRAARKSRPHPHAAVVGVVHAAAEPLRHHHAVGPALRAAPRGNARDRSAPAPADDPRDGGESADLHDGRHPALPVGDAHPFHRMRRQHRNGVGQRRGADRPVLARDARLQRMDRRRCCRRCSTNAASTAGARSSCWPRVPTARR